MQGTLSTGADTSSRALTLLLVLPCALAQFMEWARSVCVKLQEAGHWCDYIDPCSGLPVSSARSCVQLTWQLPEQGCACTHRQRSRGPASSGLHPRP